MLETSHVLDATNPRGVPFSFSILVRRREWLNTSSRYAFSLLDLEAEVAAIDATTSYVTETEAFKNNLNNELEPILENVSNYWGMEPMEPPGE